MHLFLIGYRGSGKTTVARLLAERLGWSWVDTDAWIEAAAGLAIREIFAHHGESGFRDREERAVAEVVDGPPQVVSLGGGAILRRANRDVLRSSGKTVWLEADAEVLAARIAGDAGTGARRPSLTGLGQLDEVRALLRQRGPLYAEAADFRVATDGRTPEEIAEVIVAWFAEQG